jgi:hypothetical protein
MTDDKPKTIGKCRCGQVQFEVSSEPLMTMACHCTGCQRMTASAFSLSTLHPRSGFTVTRGEPVIGGLHSTNFRHRRIFRPCSLSLRSNVIPAADTGCSLVAV